jgi:hypothetical protein
MDILIGFLVFSGIFALYDALRKINNNIIEQTAEIKKLREDLVQNNNQ